MVPFPCSRWQDDEDEGDDAVLGGRRLKAKGKPFLGTGTGPGGRRASGSHAATAYKSKSLQDLRKGKATTADVLDVLQSDENPLAAREYAKVKEAQRVRVTASS